MAEQNPNQTAGPFGGTKEVALMKTIEHKQGAAMPGGSGESVTWAGTTLNAGSYVSAVRTYTFKSYSAPTTYNYDMVYTSNARGQAEKTLFIDADDSTTRTSTRYYTWRDRVRKATHPDTNSLEYEYDDHLRMTKEKLQGADEYYEFDWCICGPVKRHRYHYKDSLLNAQDMDWTNTTDNAGRLLKEFYPYTIAKHGSDEYRSVLYEYDRANRREFGSDPTFGHICADTSGWTNHIENVDEDNWTFDEPQVYRYGMQGNVEAMGRVKGKAIVAGTGEPYFVQRDNLGRASSVVYPDLTSSGLPQGSIQNEYWPDGRLKETAFVSAMQAGSGIYGPEQYVVQLQYDDAGRLMRKVVRNNTASDATRFEESFEYDGMGRTVREKILAWDSTNEKMAVKQDIRTTYDLGGNPTEIKFYDDLGLAYTETRTYARGYQITGASFSDVRADVTVSTSGSYTYDTNNNITGTKKADAHITASGLQLSYRAQWTFTYDRKNRLKTFTNAGMGVQVMNLWYDALGRVWQRWIKTGANWNPTLTRLVYDGSQLIQEHTVGAQNQGNQWVYTYQDITRDYLRQPGGLRERQRTEGTDVDYFMQGDSGRLDCRAKRGDLATTKVQVDRTRSLSQMSGGTFNDLSHLATSGQFIESYGGGTTGASAGFDPLILANFSYSLAGFGGERTGRWRGDVLPSDGNLADSRGSEPSGQGEGGGQGSASKACDCQGCYDDWLQYCKLVHKGIGGSCSYKDLCCENEQECIAICPGGILGRPCDGNFDKCKDKICGEAGSSDRNCICGQLTAGKDLETAWSECNYCGKGSCCILMGEREVAKQWSWQCTPKGYVGTVNCYGECFFTRYEYRRRGDPCENKVLPYERFMGHCRADRTEPEPDLMGYCDFADPDNNCQPKWAAGDLHHQWDTWDTCLSIIERQERERAARPPVRRP